MAKEEGAKTVVLGGKNDVQQRYCGTVGGESTDFSTIDTQVKVSLVLSARRSSSGLRTDPHHDPLLDDRSEEQQPRASRLVSSAAAV